jgi:hypothetical protein
MPTCQSCPSKKSVVYGYEFKKPLFCKQHKTDQMIFKKICETPGCKMRATFGTDDKKPSHCAVHKVAGERDVMYPRD